MSAFPFSPHHVMLVAFLIAAPACGDDGPPPSVVGLPGGALTFDAAGLGPPLSGRDGGATPRGQCEGLSTACELMGWACSGVDGCTSEAYCVGAALGCYGRTDYACATQDGCYWASSRCQGSATPCSVVSQAQCRRQLGCFVDSHCVGSPTPCTLLDRSSTCLAQPGCTWRAG